MKMRAEYPHDLPEDFTVIDRVAFYEESDCSMWRFGQRCPNTAVWGIVCTASNAQRFIVAQCSMCLEEIRSPEAESVFQIRPGQSISAKLTEILDFSPVYQQRISMADILERLDTKGRDIEMAVATILKRLGATKERTRDGARWNGIRWKA